MSMSYSRRFAGRRLLALIALLSVSALVLSTPGAAAAQAVTTDSCTYHRCALGIVPAWNGLLITRGAEQQRVANLGFFWTGSLDRHFAGSDSARAYARRAVRVRRVAAVLTDVGAMALGYAGVRMIADGHLSAGDRAVAIGGAAAFGMSVPLQFAADGLLSRAIWWQNSRYGTR